jgi:hypothetical protein
VIVLCPRQRYVTDQSPRRCVRRRRCTGSPELTFAQHSGLACRAPVHVGPSRKVPCGCKDEAQSAADEINKRPDRYGLNYSYSCVTCGQWHIGRPHKGKTLQ